MIDAKEAREKAAINKVNRAVKEAEIQGGVKIYWG